MISAFIPPFLGRLRWLLLAIFVVGFLSLSTQNSRATDLGINSISPQTVPCGKTLVVPVAAHGDGPLNFTVKSSDPKIIPLVKTGNPYLQIAVSYAGTDGITTGTVATPAFSGTLVFQLFREYAPKTVVYIGGFAQAGYYDNVPTPVITGSDAQVTGTYNSRIFHRIANLTGTASPTYIAQGGDPDANNPSTTGTLTHGPGFAFDNEFSLPLIFSGKGQLAMANSNGTAGYQGTNGSQFFISQGTLRFLDFNHTIFGQLVRDDQQILDQLMAVPVDSNNKPLVDVVMDSVSLVNDGTDTVLFLSAAGMVSGTANVTVTATDPGGNSTSQVFAVTSYADTVNDPPILGPVSNVVAARNNSVSLPITGQDLEFDYLFPGGTVISNPLNASVKLKGNIVTVNPGGQAGRVVVGLNVSQYGQVLRSDPADRKQAVVGLGVRSVIPVPFTLHATPGQPIPNDAVAIFRAASVSGTQGNFSAKINWGDGTPLTSGSDVSITRTVSPANGFLVSGSHTFARPGQYQVVVTGSDSLGSVINLTTPAIVSDSSLVALGRDLSASGGAFSGREIASFTDSDGPGNPSDYTALIDWGDGVRNAGVIRKSPRGFSVLGTHRYLANTSNSIRIDVTKNSTAATAVAWGSVLVKGVSATRLPPFPLAHIVGQLYSTTPTSSNSLATGVYLINTGNKTSSPVTLRFYLSNDLKTPLKVASFYLPVGTLKPTAQTSFAVRNIQVPAGVSTTGQSLVMEVVYSDPIGDWMDFTRLFYSNALP